MTINIQTARETMDQMYLERDQMGDVTFLVDSQRIRAHRIVLATQSPKYKAQFYGPRRDEGEIHVPHVSAAAFNVFLQFFYKELVDLTMDNIGMVLDLAKQSLADKFVETCVNFLKNQIEANKLSVAYRLANLYDIESLRLDCEQQITTKTMDVFASDDFLCWDRDMLVHILEMDTLNCSEAYVFRACIAWARVQCKRTSLDDGKSENLRTVLGDAIYQIRFSSFSAEEFADLHKSMKGFFTADESIELFYITSKLKDFRSQKFNQTTRASQSEPQQNPMASVVGWSLEINRFLRIKWQSVNIERSQFSFTSNKPIRLHGIALGIHFNPDELSKFPKTLLFYDDGYKWSVVNCDVYQSSESRNETMVIFEQPIERVTHFACFLEPPFKRLDYEFDLHPTTVEHNIVLKFKGGKWVTRLFFDKYST